MQLPKLTPSKQQIECIRNGDKYITISGVKINSWDRYHFEGYKRAPRQILVKFLSEHKGEFKSALDLGAGAVADSKYIAMQGIPVRAIDQKLNIGILEHQYLNNSNPRAVQNNLTVQAQDFAHLQLPKVDFIYSYAALPFCPECSYINMITNIASSVNKDGYLALHFFESKHPFVKQNKAGGFSAQQLEDAFNLLGFTNTQTIQWTSTQLQNGQKLPNLNSIFLTARAPEKLAEFSREDLQQILGLKAQQEEPEDHVTVPVSKIYGFSCETSEKTFSIEPIPEGLTEVRSALGENHEQQPFDENDLEAEDLETIKTSLLEEQQKGEELYATTSAEQETEGTIVEERLIKQPTIDYSGEGFIVKEIKGLPHATNIQGPTLPPSEDLDLGQ